jgi:phage repressor protein C with HTH and peptisase S24 domain
MLYSYTDTKAILYETQALIDAPLPVDNQSMIDTEKPSSAKRLGKRIDEEIKKSKKTAAAIAKECGVTPQAITGWKKYGRISKDMLQVLANVLEIPMSEFFPEQAKSFSRSIKSDWIDVETHEATETTPARRVTDLAPQSAHQIVIPHYPDIGGSMGGGLLLRDQPGEIQGLRVTDEWVNKNVKQHTGAGNLRVVTGFGDSMRPLYNPGDPLLVDIGVKVVEFDSIYFFRIGDEGFIKRLQRVPGQGLLAISENKSYRDWVITPDMDFEVFARVIKVWCGSEF